MKSLICQYDSTKHFLNSAQTSLALHQTTGRIAVGIWLQQEGLSVAPALAWGGGQQAA